jgi:tetratricopeptide (TPR) repeat protein
VSLLLEALKKAERSKHDSVPQAATTPETGGLSLLDESGTAAGPAVASAPESTPAEPRSETERKAAEQLFSAKSAPQPKRIALTLIPVAVLAAVAGGGYYFWQQMQRLNRPEIAPVTRPSPGVAPAARTTPTAPSTASAPAAPSAPSAPVTAPQAAGPGTAATPPAPPVAQAPSPAEPKSTAAPPQERARNTPAPAAIPVARAAPERIRIQRSQSTAQLDPNLSAGYQALNRGELDAAQDSYSRVLRTDPNNRDALLGLAATATKRNNFADAQRLYQKVLELNPRDPEANAALVGLRPQADAVQAESRIKTLIAQQPESGVLNFALGNLYAGQSRWAEAQQAYFRAYSQDSGNADYAFNLAVSLDQLGQRRLAAEYYRRALSLGASGSSTFDRVLVSQRLQEIE